LVKAGLQESRAYAHIVAVSPTADGEVINIGKLIVYNEYEGQELFQLKDKIGEDGIIIIKEENILAIIE
jgi:co-chaperonin GroES (HSP10)